MESYKFPFIRPAEPCYIGNNRSAEAHCEFVEEAIAQLLYNDCIQEHSEPLYIVLIHCRAFRANGSVYLQLNVRGIDGLYGIRYSFIF